MYRWMQHYYKELPKSQQKGLALGAAALMAVTALLYVAILLRCLRVLGRVDRALRLYIKEHTPPRKKKNPQPEEER